MKKQNSDGQEQECVGGSLPCSEEVPGGSAVAVQTPGSPDRTDEHQSPPVEEQAKNGGKTHSRLV